MADPDARRQHREAPSRATEAPSRASEAPSRTARERKPAGERRAEVIAVAVGHFARGGYHGTSTEAIAADVGLSQPYLFRLFGTKRELFLACHDAVEERVAQTFEQAAAGPGGGRGALERMGRAYIELLADRELLLFQMQSYAACSDPLIQEHVRRRYGELVALAGRLSGAGPEVLWGFFSTGMLLNVVASLDLEAIAAQQPWAARWCRPGEWLATVEPLRPPAPGDRRPPRADAPADSGDRRVPRTRAHHDREGR